MPTLDVRVLHEQEAAGQFAGTLLQLVSHQASVPELAPTQVHLSEVRASPVVVVSPIFVTDSDPGAMLSLKVCLPWFSNPVSRFQSRQQPEDTNVTQQQARNK